MIIYIKKYPVKTTAYRRTLMRIHLEESVL